MEVHEVSAAEAEDRYVEFTEKVDPTVLLQLKMEREEKMRKKVVQNTTPAPPKPPKGKVDRLEELSKEVQTLVAQVAQMRRAPTPTQEARFGVQLRKAKGEYAKLLREMEELASDLSLAECALIDAISD